MARLEEIDPDAALEHLINTRNVDPGLDRQAQILAEKALEKLPEGVRAAKLPKVKEGIIRRLRQQQEAATSSEAVAAAAQPPPPEHADEAPPPPPPDEDPEPLPLEGVEGCGDEAWFSYSALRRALHERVVAAHAEQKILVAGPAEEVRRICPEDGRVLGAGAVLRLGGALGGYGEADIGYAYRQLSRALHPDKHPDLAGAAAAFKRLSEAAEELKQGLVQARSALQLLCTAMNIFPTAEMMERPQEALFAEATRLLSAVLSLSGEGDVPGPALARSSTALAASPAYRSCHGQLLLHSWYEKSQLLGVFATPALRTAYDCSPKRFRAQFLCLLNRATLAEAKRQCDCVRGDWQEVLEVFPEVALWRELRAMLSKRVWTLDPDDKGSAPIPKPPREKYDPTEPKDGKLTDPICWNFVTDGFCKKGAVCRYMHALPEGYDVQKASVAKTRGRGVAQPKKEEPKTSAWARAWRGVLRAVLPAGIEAAATALDPELRRLAAALWSDVAAWAADGPCGRCLRLFSAEPGPGWAFVPATDLLLAVGEGFVGATCEGAFADGRPRPRQSFEDAALLLGAPPEPPPAGEERERSRSRPRP